MDSRFVACHECDTVHRQTMLQPGHAARCSCCGGLLYRRSRITLEHYLALVMTGLIVMVIAQGFPIMGLELQGVSHASSLFQAILSLHREGMNLVAFVVIITTTVFPLFELGLLGLILALLVVPGWRERWVGVAYKYPVLDIHMLLRALLHIRPWVMLDVFMMATLVALVKLSHTATLTTGIGLWAFAVLAFLFALISGIEPRSLWEHLEALERGDCK